MPTERDDVPATGARLALKKTGRAPCSARFGKSKYSCQFAQHHCLAPQRRRACAGSRMPQLARYGQLPGRPANQTVGNRPRDVETWPPQIAAVDLQQTPPRR